MLLRRSVTARTLHSRGHRVQRQLPALCGIRGVAAEAAQFVVTTYNAPGSIDKVGRHGAPGAHRDAESFQFAEITDAAFIQLAVFFENISLPDGGTSSHHPSNGHRQALDSIRDGINALVAPAFNAV